ncbi:MAG TPA: nicotinate phosphoribosyltransferase [Acidimicrobiales bacterium]|nr:nicotinate phosphoribosyltransferase [Acidimicrobiales bacterium]
MTASSALHTDHYELTMLEAALGAGTAGEPATFEVFTRAVPQGRRFGVFAGLGRLLDLLERFTFGPDELGWLEAARVVGQRTLDWLGSYRFSGDIHAYAEGDLYTGGSPVLTVEGTFGEAVLLETLVLSVLNHDSAVAAAASLIVEAAGGRPLIEMGSRRTDAEAAVAAARAAYLGGFDSSSNLEAGRRYGVPTAGTAAHAFIQSFSDEKAAFVAQVAAAGSGTTLLVDTYDTERGICNAVEVAGPGLGAIRIDSGDLVVEAERARSLLDSLGATNTRVVITGDLDDEKIRSLSDSPADAYGVGTSVVTGLGSPTAGFVYKLAVMSGRSVSKKSPGKVTVGGRKWAWRIADACQELVSLSPEPSPPGGRPLQSCVVRAGKRLEAPTLVESREHHRRAWGELPPAKPLELVFRSAPTA